MKKVKIVDFGIAGFKGQTTDSGTVRYMSPELLDRSKIAALPGIDVWALGVIFYLVLFNRFPFLGSSRDEIKDKVIEAKFQLPEEMDV